MTADRVLDPDLLRRMDAQARNESERAERQAAELAVRRRSLADAAWEAAQCGRLVEVRAGGFAAEGAAVYARGDLLSLRTARGGLEVCLPHADALLVRPETSPVISQPEEVESFAARMAEAQINGEEVEAVVRGGGRFPGRLEAAARDHLVLKTPGGRTLLPLASVACVIRPR